ncbi:ABC transporter substrate-binding protein [Rhodoblastus sphagnicola]|uniref:ABC transporter substrate-binding protein n=1 Tax=Rhodoblastus sphagnicola TaxID=333368 RepID=A0A2S6NC16_9HYPH|nr:ABC transporter substrate-binding protein [Rhodoblastus sphagnicola]MBB4197462.1 ABC transporter substrate binding protein (PQQ-dependent alcohol dehydrogenase system) [Rhodoblastus sphagnicola]PPQ32165.1 ABC transporter substrate-binding protein [Rhodoblastus sphagnicola]
MTQATPGSLALRRFSRAFSLAGLALVLAAAAWADPLKIEIAFIARARAPSPPYVIDAPPPGEGFDGAKLAVQDNATTGAFLDQSFELRDVELGEDESPVEAAKPLLARGVKMFVSALPADETLALADALKTQGALLFNAGATDDFLRGSACRSNLFHTAPSRAMLTDALAQYLAVRRWSKVLLVPGPNAGDAAYASAFRASAKKFGVKIVAEKPWAFGPLARARSDAVTEAEALTFARNVEADLIVVADEADDFGDYILYRTAEPRLVAGTQGLTPVSWHPTHTAYGSEQLQNRFIRMTKRRMRPIDYQAWIAVRAIGEAVTELRSADPAKIGSDMQGPGFNLAIFKGAAASFRPWDRQLRQAILLAQPKSLIGLAPLPEFLHQRNTLDSLGVDASESACKPGTP